MYLDHRTVDSKCNIIVDCYITKGNVHDVNDNIRMYKKSNLKMYNFVQSINLKNCTFLY